MHWHDLLISTSLACSECWIKVECLSFSFTLFLSLSLSRSHTHYKAFWKCWIFSGFHHILWVGLILPHFIFPAPCSSNSFAFCHRSFDRVHRHLLFIVLRFPLTLPAHQSLTIYCPCPWSHIMYKCVVRFNVFLLFPLFLLKLVLKLRFFYVKTCHALAPWQKDTFTCTWVSPLKNYFKQICELLYYKVALCNLPFASEMDNVRSKLSHPLDSTVVWDKPTHRVPAMTHLNNELHVWF